MHFQSCIYTCMYVHIPTYCMCVLPIYCCILLPPSSPSLLLPRLQKTYKYGCDLLSTAQRSRKTSHLEEANNAGLLDDLASLWEGLSAALVEARARLEVAQQFHHLADEVRINLRVSMRLLLCICSGTPSKHSGNHWDSEVSSFQVVV